MILAVDVHYRDNTGFCAGLLFESWEAKVASASLVTVTAEVGEYVPGAFYQRELPCILQLLARVREPLDCIVIDGFVFLDGKARPGLGKYLYDALRGITPVIGVAKSPFAGLAEGFEVFHGASQRPLYVTAVGCAVDSAQAWVDRMHGPFRLPTMLKAVDQLCRRAAQDSAAPDRTSKTMNATQG